MATTVARYPYELSLNKDTHYVQFEFLEFKTGGVLTNTAAATSAAGISAYSGDDYEKKFQVVKGFPKILLYMPDDQGTQVQASWGGKSFTFTGLQAVQALASSAGSDNFVEGITKLGVKGVEGVMNTFTTGGGGKTAAASLFAGVLGLIPGIANNVSASDLLQGGSSQIINPNVEMFYEGPQMRTLGMKFSMAARSPGEAAEIAKIVKAFRMAAAPSFSGANSGQSTRLIKIPSYVKMRYMVGGKDNQYLPKHKLMNIMSVDVRYDNGMYQTFSDDRPLYTELTINFQESKIIFREDIDNGF